MSELTILYHDKSVEPTSQGLNWYTTTGMHLRNDPTQSGYEEGVLQMRGLTKSKKPSTASIAIPIGDIPQLIATLQNVYDENRPV